MSPKERQHTVVVSAGGPRRVFVDSGGWIAFFSRRDTRHGEADALLRAATLQRTMLVTTNLVLAEVHRWLLFRAGIRAARAALERIEVAERVVVEFATAAEHQAARGWLAGLDDQPISYTDAVSFAVMEARRCGSVITFDRDFVIAGFQRFVI